jgi:hypothetical protein
VLAVGGDFVTLSTGRLRRRDVRLAIAKPRPDEVDTSQRWVAIDLTEQTLVAYEGDKPVFATLVSTGKEGHETPVGSFSVWMKAGHHTMTGRENEKYQVDEVPSVMFFNRGVALHGAFWHDSFGRTFSHGCVNLSIADAEWLYAWAPPTVPEGWHASIPKPSGRATLQVIVEKSEPIRSWTPPTKVPAPSQPVVAPPAVSANVPAELPSTACD